MDNNTATKEFRRKDGKLYRLEHHRNGKWHCDNGPACIDYYDNSSIYTELYFKYDKRHREDGPAFIHYNEDGSIKGLAFFKDNTIVDPDIFTGMYDRNTGKVTDMELF